jgi:methyltransferase
MAVPLFALSIIAGMLLAETRLSRRHELELRKQGAVEPSDDVYRLMAFAYPAAFVLMVAEGMVRGIDPGLFVAGALLFAASKALKYWAIGSLGTRWTFRVLVLPGVPLVTRGPYAYISHPNYLGVLGELVGTAMMMKAWTTGPLAVAGFGALLWRRIAVETRALKTAYEMRDGTAPHVPASD